MRIPSAILTTLLLAPLASAQENLELGKMWTLENPPLAYLQEEYGFAPDQNWLDKLRLASIRFGGGCSSSFVSPKGLIMTNHHCIRGEIAQVQGENDWLNQGFYAKTMEEEVPVPGLTVQQLVTVESITDRVNQGIEPGDDDDTIASKRKRNQAEILAEFEQKTQDASLKPEIVTLYQGAVFQLYVYKAYDDIRLVCSPHLQTAHFGGDPDNFTYPRFGIDFTFCRAYENDKPIDTSEHYFRWNTTGVLEDDVVFVTGNPGTTKRLLTLAQLEYHRDVWHPVLNTLIDNRLAIRREIAAKHPERKKDMQPQILSLENAQKAYGGYFDGLKDPALMAQKRRAEKAFQRRIQSDEALNRKFGDVWRRIEEATARRADVEPKRRLQTTGNHPRLAQAVLLLRGNGDRAAAIAGEIDVQARMDFIDHVERARAWLKGDDIAWLPKAPAVEIADLLEKSKLGDADHVRALANDAEMLEKSDDVAITIARALMPLMDRNRQEHDEVAAIEAAQGARIGQALHAAYGSKVSPDATLTLRFSDGRVKGYPYNGTLAPYRTTFFGLYARNAEFDNEYPFDLPQVWLDRKDKVDMTKSVNLVSTNDIIGGNSGSPLVNKDLEVVGLVFDGNIEMLPNRYLYRGEIPRSVSVHVDAIMESLKKIYDADRIVRELVPNAGN